MLKRVSTFRWSLCKCGQSFFPNLRTKDTNALMVVTPTDNRILFCYGLSVACVVGLYASQATIA